jgi:hypothetical protein
VATPTTTSATTARTETGVAGKIEIVSCPRPDDDNLPLPTYHQLLNHLCTELGVPGSPTFFEAVAFIKERLRCCE